MNDPIKTFKYGKTYALIKFLLKTDNFILYINIHEADSIVIKYCR
jgi:hypothetical protein